eukprot:scaffold256017_cov18-Tisochrysis_lutea.AAC.1
MPASGGPSLLGGPHMVVRHVRFYTWHNEPSFLCTVLCSNLLLEANHAEPRSVSTLPVAVHLGTPPRFNGTGKN